MNAVTVRAPLVMAEWVPRKERFELSLIFMVAASVGEVVLASRGFPTAGYVAASLAGGFMFYMLWVLPTVSLKNVVRTLILAFLWSVLFTGIQDQIQSLLMPDVPMHEVSSR